MEPVLSEMGVLLLVHESKGVSLSDPYAGARLPGPERRELSQHSTDPPLAYVCKPGEFFVAWVPDEAGCEQEPEDAAHVPPGDSWPPAGMLVAMRRMVLSSAIMRTGSSSGRVWAGGPFPSPVGDAIARDKHRGIQVVFVHAALLETAARQEDLVGGDSGVVARQIPR